jgi:hypothetical protein
VETFAPFVAQWYHISQLQEWTCLNCIMGNLFYDSVPVYVIRVISGCFQRSRVPGAERDLGYAGRIGRVQEG